MLTVLQPKKGQTSGVVRRCLGGSVCPDRRQAVRALRLVMVDRCRVVACGDFPGRRKISDDRTAPRAEVGCVDHPYHYLLRD